MSLDPTPVFVAIRDRVQEIMGKTEVYENEIPPDSAIPTNSQGLMKPFVVLYYGGPIRSGRDRSLVTTRRDLILLYITIEVYAPSAQLARELKGKLVEELTGMRTDDMSELTLSGFGMSQSRASNTVRPTMYIETQAWQCFSNLKA